MTDEKEPTILVIDPDEVKSQSFKAPFVGIKEPYENFRSSINPLMPGPVPVKIYSRLNYIPQYATSGSSGVDVRADLKESVTIAPRSQAIIDTGLYVAIPEGYEIQARGRSGLAYKYSVAITHGVGTIDADYRGEIKGIMFNHSDTAFTVNPGDRIMQLVLCPVMQMHFVQVENVEDLDSTSRGHQGFGSTGHN